MTARILKLMLTFALLGVALGGPLLAGTRLVVVPAAALDGTAFGLKVKFTTAPRGRVGKAYLVDSSPTGETSYNASFFINPVNMKGVLPANGRIDVFRAQDSSGQFAFLLGVRKKPGGKIKLTYRVREVVGHRKGQTTLVRKDSRVDVSWTSAVAGADGTFRVLLDGVEFFSASDLTLVQTIEKALFGVVGANSFADVPQGVFYLDEFESFRTLAP